MDNEHQKLKIHFIYIVSFLTFLLILIATKQWTKEEGFTAFLSNAATATSLVLGVIAIIYAFVSNSDLSKGLGNITLASNEISKTRDQLSEFLGQASELNKSGIENSKKLHDVSSNITNSVVGLNSALEAISSQTESLHQSMKIMPERMDRIESKIDEQKANSQTTTNHAHFTDTEIDQFLRKAPLSGDLIALACALAYKNKAELDIDLVAKNMGTDNPSFLNGMTVAMHAIGLLERKSVKGKSRVYTITQINSNLTPERIKKYTTEYLSRQTLEVLPEKTAWQNRIEIVENMFIN